MKIIKYYSFLFALIFEIVIPNMLKKIPPNDKISLYNEEKAKLISNYLKGISCAKKPLKRTCINCFKPNDGNKFVHFFLSKRHNLPYKLLVHYNDDLQTIYFFFSGPIFNKSNIKYFSKYFLGNKAIKRSTEFENEKINKELHDVYFSKIKKKITKTLDRLVKSNRDEFNIIFAGNSVGGSLATLSAYDIKTNYQKGKFTNYEIFAFNSFDFSDEIFHKKLKSSGMKIYRIYKENDFIISPNCVYDINRSKWRCNNINDKNDLLSMLKNDTQLSDNRRYKRKLRKNRVVIEAFNFDGVFNNSTNSSKVQANKTIDGNNTKSSNNKTNPNNNKTDASDDKNKDIDKNNNKTDNNNGNLTQNNTVQNKNKTDDVKQVKNQTSNENKNLTSKDNKKIDMKNSTNNTSNPEKNNTKIDNSNKTNHLNNNSTNTTNKANSTINTDKNKTNSNQKDNNNTSNNKTNNDTKKSHAKNHHNKKLQAFPKRENNVTNSTSLEITDINNAKRVGIKSSCYTNIPKITDDIISLKYLPGIYGEVIVYNRNMQKYDSCSPEESIGANCKKCIINLVLDKSINKYSHLNLFNNKLDNCKLP